MKAMHILFVCTGNIPREAERLLQRNHISQMTVDAFRSRRLTAAIAAAEA